MRMFLLVILLFQLLFLVSLIAFALIKTYIKHGKLIKNIYWLQVEGVYYILNASKLNDYLSNIILHLHLKLFKINGSNHTKESSIRYIAQLLAISQLLILVFTFLAFIKNDSLILVVGMFFSAIVILYKYLSLDKLILCRKREVIIELPFLLNSLVLMLNAGESLQIAFIRISKSYQLQIDSYFKEQLLLAMNELENGTSFIIALENLNQRIGVYEMSIFTSTLILNTRRGNKDLVLILENLAKEFWNRRLTEARIVGEEASAKLIFPMILIFIVVIIIIATPAILIF